MRAVTINSESSLPRLRCGQWGGVRFVAFVALVKRQISPLFRQLLYLHSTGHSPRRRKLAIFLLTTTTDKLITLPLAYAHRVKREEKHGIVELAAASHKVVKSYYGTIMPILQ